MSIDPTKPLPVNEGEKQGQNREVKPHTGPTSWKPGESGNPAGRPKTDWTWKDLLEEVAEEEIELKGKDGTTTKHLFKKLIAKKLFQKAFQGDIQAIREIMNRRDGMPKQKVDVEAEGNWNVTLKRDEK